MRHRVGQLLAGCVAAGVAVGCGGTNRLDPVALARVLPSQLVPDHPEVVTEVVCPDRIDKRVGDVARCTAVLAGVPVVVTVTQLDANGAVRAELDRPLLDVNASVATLAARFTADLAITTIIECVGAPVRVLVVGEVLQCTARDPSLRSRPIAVTVLDRDGTLDAALS